MSEAIQERTALLGEFVADLRAAARHAEATVIEWATAREGADAALAHVLHDVTDHIPLVGRQIFLRTTCLWLARSFDAACDGDAAEADRWAERAGFELQRYREQPEGACL